MSLHFCFLATKLAINLCLTKSFHQSISVREVRALKSCLVPSNYLNKRLSGIGLTIGSSLFSSTFRSWKETPGKYKGRGERNRTNWRRENILQMHTIRKKGRDVYLLLDQSKDLGENIVARGKKKIKIKRKIRWLQPQITKGSFGLSEIQN